jgi:predicted aldo/keto reductase-like oxidoreductase
MEQVFKRKFPRLNADCSLLGFGCMRFPQMPDGSVDTEQTQSMIDYAYAAGVNYYDTAYVYGGGKSERAMAAALAKYPRESYYLANKMPAWAVKTPGDAERIFDEELKRCRTGYFDFYLCHAIDLHSFKTKYEKFLLDFLIEKKKCGIIKRLGFSFHDDSENLEYIASYYPWDFAQIQVNYLDWEKQNAELLYNVLKAKNIPAVIMEPVRGGLLASPCADSDAVFKAAAPDKSVASWALRYVMSLEGVAVVLSGMSTLEQVKDNVSSAADFKPLERGEYAVIESALAAYKKFITVPCTACRYCSECPVGIDIPLVFSHYNEFKIKGGEELFKKRAEENYAVYAENCLNCGECKLHCPQKIDVPERLREVREALAKAKA